MITYTHNAITVTLTPDQALATLASLEAPTHRIHTPTAQRGRASEARSLRAAMGRAPMGNVSSVTIEPSSIATLPAPPTLIVLPALASPIPFDVQSMYFSHTAEEMHASASEYASR